MNAIRNSLVLTNSARNSGISARNSAGISARNSARNSGGIFGSWMYLGLLVVAVMVLFGVYYVTIGYSINIGWANLWNSRNQGESVLIQAPGGLTATMTPDDSGLIGRLEADVESALGEHGGNGGNGGERGRKQVFNIRRNIYTYHDAEPLCRAFGAELATYDQVKDAYERGADWCNYGWTKGQLALYPTQQSTFDKLQRGPEHERGSCGLPGINGGYFPNADMTVGVNCFGVKPPETALDERDAQQPRTGFDREEAHFRAERDSIAIAPWAGDRWSE